MAYTAFCDEKQEYLNRVTPQGTAESIPHIPEKIMEIPIRRNC